VLAYGVLRHNGKVPRLFCSVTTSRALQCRGQRVFAVLLFITAANIAHDTIPTTVRQASQNLYTSTQLSSGVSAVCLQQGTGKYFQTRFSLGWFTATFSHPTLQCMLTISS
jgi:hypothetical protein